MAGVKFDAHYSVTSVDPPEVMRFIKKQYPEVIWEHPLWDDDKPEHHFPDGRPRPITMWSLIADHTIPPTRQARYCCSALKEVGGAGRLVITGVRWAESARRKALHGVADIQTESKALHEEASESPTYRMNKSGGIIFLDDNDQNRMMVERCYLKKRTTVNPIIDWTDEDVWEFLNDVAKVPHCELYDVPGITRIGCIGCPLQGREGMLEDFERYPRYKELYIRAFDKMIKNHPGEIRVATGELVDNGSGGGTQYSGSGSDGAREQTQSPATMVADADGNGELRVLDSELLNGEAANVVGGSRMIEWWLWMCRHDFNSEALNPLTGQKDKRLMEADYDGMIVGIEEIQPQSVAPRAYNPDPRVADYENAEEVMEFWLGE